MNRIKELRISKGWLQKDLAAHLNVSKGAVSNYEIGKRQLDPETITALCDIFNCSADYLLCRSDERNGNAAAPKDDGMDARTMEWAAAWEAASPAARAAALAVLMIGAQPPAPPPAAPASDE